MGQWRIRSLRKAAEPFLIPGLKPMMGIMRRKKDMEVRIEGAHRKLHRQQRPLDRQRDQHDCAKRYWTRVGSRSLHNLHSAVSQGSIATRWIQKSPYGFTRPSIFRP